MSDEKELVKKRASYKGRLTFFINYLSRLSDEPLTANDIRELQLRIGKIELLYSQYDEVQTQLECSVENVDEQLAERSDFESNYFKAIAKAQGFLTETDSMPMVSMGSERGTQAGKRQLVKLPTIQLPKFCGSYDNYMEFRDTFTSLIHNNDDIDEINKFHYLRACLEGSAAVVIQSIDFSASNYAVAWKLLCERYDNKRLLIQSHVSALFNLDAITKESSVVLKRLIDQINKNLRALESLGEPVKHWDTLLIYIFTQKLDQKTYREWEEFRGHLDRNGSLKLDDCLQFLRSRADLIETLELSRSSNQSSSHNRSNPKLKSMVAQSPFNLSTENASKHCPKCKGDHALNTCPRFLALSNEARLKALPTFKICFNCFRAGHYANTCKKPGCKICKRRHNTLVHVTEFKDVAKVNHESTEPDKDTASSGSLSVNHVPKSISNADSNVALSANIASPQSETQSRDVLLSTALVKLIDKDNCEHIVRAVLDSGSTSCLITEKICHKLNLPTNEIDRSILGINNVSSHVGKTCQVNMKSLNDSFMTNLHCYVLPLITNNTPGREINISDLQIPSNISLADPMFFKPSEVDILIGADLFWDLLGSQQIRLGNKKPVLCNTKLGWIISGPLPNNYVSLLTSDVRCNFNKISSPTNNETDIQTDLMRFWQLEEINLKSSHYSPDEKLCEEHFMKNTVRLSDGRFCVRIPLKNNPNLLGDSFQKAKQCLLSLERKMLNKPDINKMYHEFMIEYQLLGHMTESLAPNPEIPAYFMPHHGVLRECSTTTKLRVVFNASSPTTSGVSLNDLQLVGPTVQDDLLSILLRFRQHKYIISADVEKMYRQVVVHPSDRHLQQILWRDNSCEPVKIFQLHTVTYGHASAPFLATRCLRQIGLECENPRVAETIKSDFYVDDLLTGGDDLDEVKDLRKQVTDALASAGMPLRKWVSNEPQLVNHSAEPSINLNMGTDSDEPNKLLGLGWHSRTDLLCFPIGSLLPNGNTKRDILSAIARIFDPLGLLSPCVIVMKMLLQKLWLHKTSWDEPLPSDIHKCWNNIIKFLPLLNDLRVPRHVICDSYKKLELHIFSDASERAYGACAYIRSINDQGEISVHLLLAKSRVAPIKPTTIPRLELCGALVGTRLYEKVANSLRLKLDQIYFWTDSTIVLGWLQMLPSRLQPFVRNRVAEILERTGNCTWKHVPTDHNPADLISRGVDISALQTLNMWWSGPEFLSLDDSSWPSQPEKIQTLPETRPNITLNAVADSTCHDKLIDFKRFSKYLRLVRSVAYVLRFVQLIKKGTTTSDGLEEHELRNALTFIIRQSQDESFSEYKLLLNKQNIPKKSQLLKFNVFLDSNNIMRVGGRLDNSEFSYEKRHPVILQSTNHFTQLLFDFEHKKLMHAGPQLLLASIRETYWPIGGRNLAKSCYHKCERCTRIKGKIVTPLMGNLPPQRLTPNDYPFQNVGVDYCGPIMCASRQGRGCRLVKTYIAVFICFTTKAVHLELVGDLTSKTYLLALHRFISRRGKPINIYSDNGTSFVGAYNDLSKFLKSNCNSLSDHLANDGINFHFIPAYSPHFGGLWEAGVKSVKYHLCRVLGNCNLTFEELNTTLTQIEAILNSRPLTPLSSDPADCNPLTPGHFLIGRSLVSLPQRDLQQYSTNSLTRFQRIEQLRQQFWSRWSKEYVAQLQQRVKWRTSSDNLKLDSLVVIKEDNLPPLKWKLGRVIAVHPGPDGIVRVADIRTSAGVIRRSFSKICPLPTSSTSG